MFKSFKVVIIIGSNARGKMKKNEMDGGILEGVLRNMFRNIFGSVPSFQQIREVHLAVASEAVFPSCFLSHGVRWNRSSPLPFSLPQAMSQLWRGYISSEEDKDFFHGDKSAVTVHPSYMCQKRGRGGNWKRRHCAHSWFPRVNVEK